MKPAKKNIKINISELVLEKKISRKSIPVVLKEIAMGTISTVELLKAMSTRN
ncbi:MAG: hypothetical protein R6W90_05195 [Ignavibacteriaceae bacterium]